MQIVVVVVIIIIIIIIKNNNNLVIIVSLDYKLLKKKSPWHESALLPMWKITEPFLSWRL